MTESEKMLHREIIRLETKVEDLTRDLQRAEEFNFKTYTENRELSSKLKEYDKLRAWDRKIESGMTYDG